MHSTHKYISRLWCRAGHIKPDQHWHFLQSVITGLNSLQKHYTIPFSLLSACLYHSLSSLDICHHFSPFLTHFTACLYFFFFTRPQSRFPLWGGKRVSHVSKQTQNTVFIVAQIACIKPSWFLVFHEISFSSEKSGPAQLNIREISTILLRPVAKIWFCNIKCCMSPHSLKMGRINWYLCVL